MSYFDTLLAKTLSGGGGGGGGGGGSATIKAIAFSGQVTTVSEGQYAAATIQKDIGLMTLGPRADITMDGVAYSNLPVLYDSTHGLYYIGDGFDEVTGDPIFDGYPFVIDIGGGKDNIEFFTQTDGTFEFSVVFVMPVVRLTFTNNTTEEGFFAPDGATNGDMPTCGYLPPGVTYSTDVVVQFAPALGFELWFESGIRVTVTGGVTWDSSDRYGIIYDSGTITIDPA